MADRPSTKQSQAATGRRAVALQAQAQMLKLDRKKLHHDRRAGAARPSARRPAPISISTACSTASWARRARAVAEARRRSRWCSSICRIFSSISTAAAARAISSSSPSASQIEKHEDTARLQAVMPRIIDNFQIYLRELRVEDLRGSGGIYRLREELLARVNAAVAPVKVERRAVQGNAGPVGRHGGRAAEDRRRARRRMGGADRRRRRPGWPPMAGGR